jgi:NDP-sugar pyrophosphorylase family protein
VILNKDKIKPHKLPPCVVMAGGIGSRLGSITKSTPKPVIKINSRPYIIYLLDWLTKSGFKKFYFFLSFKNKKIIKVLKKYFLNKKLKYTVFIDKRRRGTYLALFNQIKKIDKFFFYTNADEISNLNIKNMYQKFKKSKKFIMCSVIKSKKGNLNLNEQKNTLKKSCNNKNILYKDCGYKFVNKKIFNKKKKYKKFEDFIYNYFMNNNNVSYYLIKDLPLRIDTANDIKRTKSKLKYV